MDFLTSEILYKPAWMWLIFFVIVVILLALDLGLFHKEDKEIEVRESLYMTGFYFAVALCFGGWIWFEQGATQGSDYLTGLLIEKSLSMDNIFVMSLVFAYFNIPRKYQHRVLFWGILGVILMRGLMIGVGAALIREFHWILYIFAAFLIYSGFKMLRFQEEAKEDIESNPILKFVKSRFRVTPDLHGHQFFIRAPHAKDPARTVWWGTPLFLALVSIDCIDVVFAVDSVPAIFAITTDEYVVYTSNVFAILGLRSLYFALAAIIARFEYLDKALALVLVFIGAKVFLADFTETGKVPASLSLGVTIALLTGGIVYSLYKTRKKSD